MKQRPSIYFIAREAGVSTATVSKIINNHGNISKETSERVLKLIQKYNYVPQQRKQSGSSIGVVVFFSNRQPLASPFTARLLNGICLSAFAQNKSLTLIDHERFSALTPEEIYCYYAGNSLAGVLLCNLAGEDPFCDRMLRSGVPFILLATNTDSRAKVNFISTRNYEAVRDLVDYMICLGHRRIAFLGMLNAAFNCHRDRVRAFTDICKAHGIETPPEYILDLQNAELQTIRNAMARLFARPEPPDALFIASEDVYEQFPQFADLMPPDLSVAGMRLENTVPRNDTREWSAIYQPVEEIGRLAVERLLELVSGKRRHVQELLDNAVHYGETVKRLKK